MNPSRPRTLAVAALATVHGLGVLGAPFAAMIHYGQADASAHQDFHVVWEAFKYFAASLVCLAIALGPLRRGERWAWWTMLAACLALFGGVFVAHALSGGLRVVPRHLDHRARGACPRPRERCAENVNRRAEDALSVRSQVLRIPSVFIRLYVWH
jgi:hypothetical protein